VPRVLRSTPPALLAGLLLAGTAVAGAASAGTAIAAPVPDSAAPPAGAAGTDQSDPALAAFYGQSPDWRRCRGQFRCATVRVPLDYTDTTQGDVGIKVIVLPAGDPDHRIGSLVLNPGGPGGSGVDFASAAPFILSGDLLDRYDVVGFDPRGVGSSDPVECLSDKQTTTWLNADPTPNDKAERQAYADISRTMAKGCQKRTPRIADHMDTELVARDLDVLRAVLGDAALHYMGLSYGTSIGSTYAELFPGRVGRVVLDGALDPALDLVEVSKGQSDGFQLALKRFVQDCPSHRDCPLPSKTGKALDRIQKLLKKLDRHPLPAAKDRPLLQSQGITAVIGSLYDDASGWPSLRSALTAAFNGNGRPMQRITDYFTDRRADGSYGSNANVALYAVSCWDYPRTPGISATRELADSWAKGVRVKELARTLAWGNLPCRYWPGRTSVPPHPVAAPGTPPILVVGTTYDPATPVQWARALADQLDAGVYLEWRGDGHTAYARGSTCATRAIDTFLLSGIPPADGTVCR
jgi:pimeloyl-ACP methyl ester carboxylesterase